MATERYFLPEHMPVLDRSVAIAEEVTSDFFAFSTSHWSRHPFEVRTLKESKDVAFPERALAHLLRYDNRLGDKRSGRDSHQLYRICLHDHNILSRVDDEAELLPLMVYVMTHELVHIARFSRHDCSLLSDRKQEEEQVVHRLTQNVLGSLPLPGLGAVVDSFQAHDV